MTKKILIVDDLLFTRELIKSFFIGSRCIILMAESGEEALDITRKEKPDLIIMDLYMPIMNGDECCSLIKSDPELKTIPVIMASSAWGHEDKEACLEAGSDDFIKKPFNPATLLEKVKSHISLTATRAERSSVDTEVCIIDTKSSSHQGKAINISASGMLIRTEGFLSASQAIGVNFCLPGFHDSIKMEGRVIRTEEIVRDYLLENRWLVGVEFNESDSAYTSAISTFIESSR